MAQKLVLVDTCFHSLEGHQYNCLRSIVDVAKSRNISCSVVANLSIESSQKVEFSAVPAFDFLGIELVTNFSDNQTTNYNYNFTHFNLRFFLSLMNALRLLPPIDRETVVFFATANFRHTLGILFWLQLFSDADRPQSVVLFRDKDLMPERAAPLHRLVLPTLTQPAFRTRLCCDGPAAVAYYSGLAGTKVDLLPVAVDPDRFHLSARAAPGADPVIAFLGQARLSKGFHLLRPIADRLWALAPAAKLLVQAQIGAFDPAHDQAIAAALAELKAVAGPRLELYEGALDYEAYIEALHRADIILLPYDPQIYRTSTSGIVVEALAAGKVVVVPADTWMAEEIGRSGAGHTAFRGHGPEPIAAALADAVLNLEPLLQASARARPAWIAEHSADRLVSYLCQDPAKPLHHAG